MPLARFVLLLVFALKISIDDVRFHKIYNKDLFLFLLILLCDSILCGDLIPRMLSVLNLVAIIIPFALFGILSTKKIGIGAGDVKLLMVLTFGFVGAQFQQIEIYFLSLWCALTLQMCLHYLFKRKFPSSVAMAPSIFFALGLYLYAPMRLLLQQ